MSKIVNLKDRLKASCKHEVLDQDGNVITTYDPHLIYSDSEENEEKNDKESNEESDKSNTTEKENIISDSSNYSFLMKILNRLERLDIVQKLYSSFEIDDSFNHSNQKIENELTESESDKKEEKEEKEDKDDKKSQKSSKKTSYTFQNKAQENLSLKIMTGDDEKFWEWVYEENVTKLSSLFNQNPVLCMWFQSQDLYWDLPDFVTEIIENSSN